MEKMLAKCVWHVLTVLCISAFCTAGKRFFQVCNHENVCRWNGPNVYNGWLSDDVMSLSFNYFDSSAVLELRDTHVQAVYITYAPSCEDVIIRSYTPVVLYINIKKCLQVSLFIYLFKLFIDLFIFYLISA
jgi:hypothetical protein